MYYKLIMSDTVTDTRIERVVEAKSVFDAIDLVAAEIDNPEETELIEATPYLMMTCGATGKECTCRPNERGEYPCKTCEHGKAWQSQPILHDDI